MKTEKESSGKAVLFVPDLCHATDIDANGNPAWHWRVGKDRRATRNEISSRQTAGGKHAPHVAEAHAKLNKPMPHVVNNEIIAPDQPAQFWPATLLPDGALEIRHPHGHTLTYSGRKYSEGKEPGTWHYQKD